MTQQQGETNRPGHFGPSRSTDLGILGTSHLEVDSSFGAVCGELLKEGRASHPAPICLLMAEKEGLQRNLSEEFRGTWMDKRPPPLSTTKHPVMQMMGMPPGGGLPPPGLTLGGETPVTPTGVKLQVLTQAGTSQNPNPDREKEPTETQPRVEEQTLTMTRSEMQKMIAEAVAAQMKKIAPVEQQPRVEYPPRVEQQPRGEQQAHRDDKKEKKSQSTGERGGSPRADKGEGRYRGWRPTQYTPLSAPHARILKVMEREIHYGHDTDDCRHLKDEIERLIKAGHLKEFIYKDRERSSKRRERSKSPRKRERSPEREELPPKRGVINMIFGGSTDGDSNQARK
ncbi:acyl-CoA-binding domain 3, partial [Striga asiatica]